MNQRRSDRSVAVSGNRAGRGAPPAAGGLDRAALAVLAVYALALAVVVLRLHDIPLYGVETDLVGEYIPAARDLLHGILLPAHYAYKGFGYPLLLAAASPLAGGDFFLAAKLLGVAAALASAWCCYRLFGALLGKAVGFAVLLGLAASPVFFDCALEAGTDMPAFALQAGSLALLLLGGASSAFALAGFLSGFALVTRYSAWFLAPCALAVLVVRRPGWRAAIAWAVGFTLPVGAWLAFNARISGSPWTNSNYLNVAYEIFGRGQLPEVFWGGAGDHIRSLADIVRYNPGEFARIVGRNLALRWWRDAFELLPWWVGLPGAAGLCLLAVRRRGFGLAMLAYLACYATLALVFYNVRFQLFLLPFNLAGWAACVLLPAPWRREPAAVASSKPAPANPPPATWRWALAAACLVAMAIGTARMCGPLLAGAPTEARAAAQLLRRLGPRGAIVMARKPHAAYLADMQYLPMPMASSYPELIAAGRSAGATYVLFSRVESDLRPQLALLGMEGVRLPGLEQVGYQGVSPTHWFALYRLTGERASPDSMRAALITELWRAARLEPRSFYVQFDLATQLLEAGRYREAAARLNVADRDSPGNGLVFAAEGRIYSALGEPDSAALRFRAAIDHGMNTAFLHDRLAIALWRCSQFKSAVQEFVAAARLDPASGEIQADAGGALMRIGKPEEAAPFLQRARMLGVNAGSGGE